MKILIPTHVYDTQAIFVKLALERVGHEVVMFYPADLPLKQRVSSRIGMDGESWFFSDDFEEQYVGEFDVVWWCKNQGVFLPKNQVHAEDYSFANQENSSFYVDVFRNISPNAWWVNSFDPAARASSKLLQLRVARKVGLSIPLTLFSNEPKDIRCFLMKYEKEGVFYKPLSQSYSWIEDGSTIKVASPTKITLENLPSNAFLQLLPGIFQIEVKKKFELKIICFGEFLVAAKLLLNKVKNSPVTWDDLLDKNMQLEFHALPPDITKKIRQFLKELGLSFACCNFIVDVDDNYHFISVDQNPNFLWMEECNPEFRMLDAFIQFLLKKSTKFRWNPHRFEHCIDRYKRLITDCFIVHKQQHFDARQPLVSSIAS